MVKLCKGQVIIMKSKATVFFLFLFIASIAAGLALKDVFRYSMIIGVGLAMFFIILSALSLSKSRKHE
ncbi:hypothetical protein [Metabacillus litoralis]|nr:hypothetical protein [Metabacillus litoralis]MCM3161467.1 hypothetical protein [Metabacillus litoralis]MCM3409301.1 hypothetical protein [Metabacillus litoralis]